MEEETQYPTQDAQCSTQASMHRCTLFHIYMYIQHTHTHTHKAKRSKAKQSSTHTLKNSFIIPQEVGIHPKKKIPRNILRKGKDKISL